MEMLIHVDTYRCRIECNSNSNTNSNRNVTDDVVVDNKSIFESCSRSPAGSSIVAFHDFVTRDLVVLNELYALIGSSLPTSSDSIYEKEQDNLLSWWNSFPSVSHLNNDCNQSNIQNSNSQLHNIAKPIDNGISISLTINNVGILNLGTHLSGCISQACSMSTKFARSFLSYANSMNISRTSSQIKAPFCKCLTTIDPNSLKLLVIQMEPSISRIDFKWEYRICILSYKAIALEDAMNWLSTLGGGYSALGDYFHYHAEKAAEISITQLKIALEMGDKATVIRCKLYIAQSHMQQGRLKLGKHIIRKQYEQCKNRVPGDLRLQSTCHGLWSRLRYLYAQRLNNLCR